MAQSKVLGLYESCINPYVRTRARIENVTGTGFEPEYQLRVADGTQEGVPKGEWTLEKIDMINVYEKIQSHRDSLQINTITM